MDITASTNSKLQFLILTQYQILKISISIHFTNPLTNIISISKYT